MAETTIPTRLRAALAAWRAADTPLQAEYAAALAEQEALEVRVRPLTETLEAKIAAVGRALDAGADTREFELSPGDTVIRVVKRRDGRLLVHEVTRDLP